MERQTAQERTGTDGLTPRRSELKQHIRTSFYFWTLLVVLLLFKIYVSETAFCTRLQVETTKLGPIDRASLCLVMVLVSAPPEDGNRLKCLTILS
jgi:hypothetical protein